MSSRTTFNAVQTPEVLTFESSLETSERQAFIPNSAPYLDSSHQREVQDDSGRPVAADICAWFSKKKSQLGFVTRRAVDEVQNNAGLLLVAASQAFFSMMNVAVKKLNGLDPPVPAFEVRANFNVFIRHRLILVYIASDCTNGESLRPRFNLT